jgi:capsular exopolysaccharide synthesis family protein
VPSTETNVLGLGLLRQSNDPSGGLSTASSLIDSAPVAAQAAKNLKLSDSPQALLAQVSVAPVANSSIVEISATTSSAQRSQNLANAFASAAVQVRTELLYRALDPAIANLRARITALTRGPQTVASSTSSQPLYQQLAEFESLRSAPDPTIQFATPATKPTSPSSPKTKLAIIGGIVAGLLIGIAGAFVLNAVDPRRPREDRLELTGLPVLTRVPVLGRSGRMRHAFDEAFRSLRTTLRFATADDPIATIAVTSASEKEGKTTTSFQLAMAMLEAGQSVLLIEADPFRPGLRALLGYDPDEAATAGLLEYLEGTASLNEIIVQTAQPGLTFVSSGAGRPLSITGLLEGERGRSFTDDMSGLADIVILDCPPVGPRSDAILIASAADAVILVADLGQSDERSILETVRRLRRAGANLLGFVLNRDSSPSQTYDYLGQSERGGPLSRRRSSSGIGSSQP